MLYQGNHAETCPYHGQILAPAHSCPECGFAHGECGYYRLCGACREDEDIELYAQYFGLAQTGEIV